ncbi:MAG TPA: SDR family oxidoreductase [Casimicrobiaceae bacterium]|nr:SDR family oxidoreductase [Casimicrobiaceae bacterium]
MHTIPQSRRSRWLRRRRNDVVVVTGASAGVGRATVREFARRGASIGLIARDPEALQATCREIEACGGRAVMCVADVSRASEVESGAAMIEDRLGPIDIWINNAMVTVVSPVAELSAEEVQRVTDVTYLGTVNGTLSALRRMRARNRGTIVQVGSALAYRAIPLQAPYCGAKFAIRGFTDALRSELMHDRSAVHVTMVQMPALNTPQFDWCRTKMPRQPQPVPPVFQPEVAARAIYYAAHHRRREILVGAPTLRAVWLNKLIPGLLDRYLAHFGYASQEAALPVAPDRRDNLFEPVLGDVGAHGRFDRIASPASAQLWLTTHRLLATLALAGMIGTAFALRRQIEVGRKSRAPT